MYIKDIFSKDPKFDLCDFQGRLNLYFLLLIHKFGVEAIERILTSAKEQADDEFAQNLILNFILPENVYELNLRLRYLWCSSTDLQTVAFEGQKRRSCEVWNEIGVQLRSGPHVKTFFQLEQKRQLSHRKLPQVQESFLIPNALRNISPLFFSRSSVQIRTKVYSCSSTLRGMTVAFTKFAEDESAAIAERNKKVQEKYANSYICDIIERLRRRPFLINAVMVPDAEDKKIAKANGTRAVIVEKDVLEQNAFMRRLFMEEFCSLSLDGKNGGAFLGLLHGYKAQVQQWVESFMKNNLNAKIQKPAPTKEDGSSLTDIESDNLQFLLTKFLDMRKKRETTKWFFKDHHYDYLIMHATSPIYIPPENVIDSSKVLDPNDLSFFIGFYCLSHKEAGRIGQTALKLGTNFTPLPYQILTCTFAHSVYDDKTCRNFYSMVLNNAKKDITAYRGEYVHEILSPDGGEHRVTETVSRTYEKIFC